MKVIDIENVNLNEAFFHFTNKENLASIFKSGLIPKVGVASEMVKENKARVYLSHDARGMLGIINSFIFEFKTLRKCDIQEGFRKYFNVDFNSTDLLTDEEIYEAISLKLKDEVYLMVDAKENVDYLEEDIYGTTSYDIKCIENHIIEADKLSLITTKNGYSAYDVLFYVYEKVKNAYDNINESDLFYEYNNCLCDMLDYLENKNKKEKTA